MQQGFQNYTDMRQGHFLNSTCDIGINKDRDMKHKHFLNLKGDIGTPIKGPPFATPDRSKSRKSRKGFS